MLCGLGCQIGSKLLGQPQEADTEPFGDLLYLRQGQHSGLSRWLLRCALGHIPSGLWSQLKAMSSVGRSVLPPAIRPGPITVSGTYPQHMWNDLNKYDPTEAPCQGQGVESTFHS